MYSVPRRTRGETNHNLTKVIAIFVFIFSPFSSPHLYLTLSKMWNYVSSYTFSIFFECISCCCLGRSEEKVLHTHGYWNEKFAESPFLRFFRVLDKLQIPEFDVNERTEIMCDRQRFLTTEHAISFLASCQVRHHPCNSFTDLEWWEHSMDYILECNTIWVDKLSYSYSCSLCELTTE